MSTNAALASPLFIPHGDADVDSHKSGVIKLPLSQERVVYYAYYTGTITPANAYSQLLTYENSPNRVFKVNTIRINVAHRKSAAILTSRVDRKFDWIAQSMLQTLRNPVKHSLPISCAGGALLVGGSVSFSNPFVSQIDLPPETGGLK